jgi:heat shock protein HtpX
MMVILCQKEAIVLLKRIFLFFLVNILVILTIEIVLSLLGIQYYINDDGIVFSSLFAFSAVVGFSGALFSLAMSRIMAKWIIGVKVLNPDHSLSDNERFLLEEVYRLCNIAGLSKMPQVGVYRSFEINAFATGPTKNRALVAVSSGMVGRMDRNAISAILGHEIAHIVNGDMVTMTLLQGVMNTFVVFLSRVCAYIAAKLVKDEWAAVVQFISVIVFDILFSLLGAIPVMAFSRWREFRADAGGAKYAGKENMIYALECLQHTKDEIDHSQRSLVAFKINTKKSWFKLFASHPDLGDRIERLRHS